MLRTFRYLHLKWICHVVTHTHSHSHSLTHTQGFLSLFLERVELSGRQSVSLCHRVELCGSSRGFRWSRQRLQPHTLHCQTGTRLSQRVYYNKWLPDGKWIVVSFNWDTFWGRQVVKDFDQLFQTTANSLKSIFKLSKLSQFYIFGPEGQTSEQD